VIISPHSGILAQSKADLYLYSVLYYISSNHIALHSMVEKLLFLPTLCGSNGIECTLTLTRAGL
jgi:hypothetical protein